MAQQGLSLLRASTAAFIAENPTSIALIPAKGTSTLKPGGGYDFTPASPRNAQNFRLIPQADTEGIQEVEDSGVVRTFDYVLVGSHDAVVAIGDEWNDGSSRYRVTGIRPSNGYEVKATVVGMGKDPSYG